MSPILPSLAKALSLGVVAVSLCLGGAAKAAPVVIVDENYNSLGVGQTVPGWTAHQPQFDTTVPVASNTVMLDGSNTALIHNDRGVEKFFAPVSGKISLSFDAHPLTGSSDGNFVVNFITSTGSHANLVRKNESDNWFYTFNGQPTFFASVTGWHHIDVDYYTDTGLYDLSLDGNQIIANYDTGAAALQAGLAIEGIWMNSGRGGAGKPSYIDNLVITQLATVPEPGALALFGLDLASLGYARRKCAA